MVGFSDSELTRFTDQEFLKAKQAITTKIVSFLAETERDLHEEIHRSGFNFPENTLFQAGKISKGENYLGLPYFVLDYPRLFSQKEVFAFRTMFWWGHELSCTLHLSGNCLKLYEDQLLTNISKATDLYFGINHTPWEFHFERDNFLPVSELTKADMAGHIREHGFVKIADRLPLTKQESYKPFIMESLARFLKYLAPI